MDKLRPEDAAVNLCLESLFEAITRRWQERDRKALSALREACPSFFPSADASCSRDRALQPVRPNPPVRSLQPASSEEVARGTQRRLASLESAERRSRVNEDFQELHSSKPVAGIE